MKYKIWRIESFICFVPLSVFLANYKAKELINNLLKKISYHKISFKNFTINTLKKCTEKEFKMHLNTINKFYFNLDIGRQI